MFWETKKQLIEDYSTKLFELYNINNSIYIETITQDVQDIFYDKLMMNLQYIINSDKTVLEEENIYKMIYALENSEYVGQTEHDEQILFYATLYDLIQFLPSDDLQSLRNGEQLRTIIEEED